MVILTMRTDTIIAHIKVRLEIQLIVHSVTANSILREVKTRAPLITSYSGLLLHQSNKMADLTFFNDIIEISLYK